MSDASIICGDSYSSTFRKQKLYEQALRPVRQEQYVEPGEFVWHPTAPVAHAQVGGILGKFVPEWQRKRAEWLAKGAPAQAVTNERPVILPQLKGLGIAEAVLKGPIVETIATKGPFGLVGTIRDRIREIIGR